ncbi:MAG: diguanylate cyclase [Arcobacteraceae bacterium]|nr:diguanylate cyclase [Arcobacteraceae bacterium]
MKIIIIFVLFFVTLYGEELQKITLQLKWKHQFQFAGYYAALHKGYYKDAGLEVNIKEATYNLNMTEEVLTKKADFGVGTSSLVLDFAKNQSLIVLGVIFQHSPLAIVSLKENTKTIHDIAHKTIMIEDGSADIYALLKREKIDLSTLHILPHTFNLEKLIRKEVDAMSVYSIDEPFFLEQQKIPYNLFSPREAGIDFYGDNLFTTKEMVDNNPKVVEDFRKASFKGWQYALSHQEEIIKLILKEYNTQNKPKEYFEFEAKNMMELIYPDILEIGYMHKGRWEHIVSVYQELGFLDDKINLNDFLYSAKKDFFQEYKTFLSILFGLILVLMISWYIAFYIYQMNKKLSKSEQRHKILFQNSASAGIVWKKGYIITDWNEQAVRLFGWSASRAKGNNLLNLLFAQNEKEMIQNNLKMITNNTNLHIFTAQNILKNGIPIVCEWHNTMIQKSDDEDDFEVVSLAIDITQRVQEEEILKIKANNDFLTNLPNRHFFENLMSKNYAFAKRNKSVLGVAFIDLDGFKAINDTYGHHAGDVLLKELAKRFQTTIRQEDMIARIGGDEFALIFHISKESEPYEKMIERILELANTPVQYGKDTTFQVSASVGISFYCTENQVSIGQLINQADNAMYEAKRKGKNCFCIFEKPF